MLDNRFVELARGLVKIYEEKYNLLCPIVLEVVNKKEENINVIEHLLDLLLDLPTTKGEELFYYLVNYYSSLNKEDADFYMNEYKNLYGEENEDVKKL